MSELIKNEIIESERDKVLSEIFIDALQFNVQPLKFDQLKLPNQSNFYF